MRQKRLERKGQYLDRFVEVLVFVVLRVDYAEFVPVVLVEEGHERLHYLRVRRNSAREGRIAILVGELAVEAFLRREQTAAMHAHFGD